MKERNEKITLLISSLLCLGMSAIVLLLVLNTIERDAPCPFCGRDVPSPAEHSRQCPNCLLVVPNACVESHRKLCPICGDLIWVCPTLKQTHKHEQTSVQK